MRFVAYETAPTAYQLRGNSQEVVLLASSHFANIWICHGCSFGETYRRDLHRSYSFVAYEGQRRRPSRALVPATLMLQLPKCGSATFVEPAKPESTTGLVNLQQFVFHATRFICCKLPESGRHVGSWSQRQNKLNPNQRAKNRDQTRRQLHCAGSSYP